MLKPLILNLLLIAAAILTMGYSISHYGDGGCDGGLCGLAIIFHGGPMAAAWFFLIIGVNWAFLKSRVSILFFVLSFFSNILVFFFFGNDPSTSAIVAPSALMIVLQVVLFFHFLSRLPGKAQDDAEPEN